MKKIIFVANRLGGGGAERILILLANSLHSQGYETVIISLNKNVQSYKTDLPVIELDSTSGKQQIRQIRHEIKKINPDTVVAFEYHVAIKVVTATLGMRCRLVVSERNDPHKLDSQLIKRILRDFAYLHSDILVCQTNDAKAYFSKRIQKKSVVILNPITDNLPEWNLENHNKTIINFCRLEKQKNIPLLLEAFSEVHDKHSDYSLAIYGSGSEEQNIQQLIVDMNLSNCVSLAPFASNIHEIAAQSAMFVSSSDFEGLSNSMLEAMAIGMPVVCTDCPIGGARMVIQDKVNGSLVPVRDKNALADAMLWMIEHSNESIECSREARKIKMLLSKDKIIGEWMKII